MKFITVDRVTRLVLKDSVRSLYVKAAEIGFGFTVSILLGRYLGPEGLGIINISNRTLSLAILVSLFGLQRLLVKEVAVARQENDFRRVSQELLSTYAYSSSIALTISIGLLISSDWIANSLFDDAKLKLPLVMFASLLPLQVLSKNFKSGMLGYERVWQSNFFEKTFSLFCTTVCLLMLFFCEYELTVATVALSYVVARIIVFLTAGVYFFKVHKHKLVPLLNLKKKIKAGSPFLLTSVTASIANNLDILILAYFVTSHEVGLYSVAAKIAFMTSIFLTIANSAISPRVAKMYAAGETDALQLLVHNTTLILLLLGGGGLSFLLFFGDRILSIWGPEFSAAFPILAILTVGQFINTASGAAGALFSMTGYEKNLLVINLFYLALNFVLCAVFIDLFGILGGAAAMALSLITFNLFKVVMVKRILGISMLKVSRLTSV